MTGYWTINQGGNARRKLLCPTETRPIDIKVNTQPKLTQEHIGLLKASVSGGRAPLMAEAVTDSTDHVDFAAEVV